MVLEKKNTKLKKFKNKKSKISVFSQNFFRIFFFEFGFQKIFFHFLKFFFLSTFNSFFLTFLKFIQIGNSQSSSDKEGKENAEFIQHRMEVDKKHKSKLEEIKETEDQKFKTFVSGLPFINLTDIYKLLQEDLRFEITKELNTEMMILTLRPNKNSLLSSSEIKIIIPFGNKELAFEQVGKYESKKSLNYIDKDILVKITKKEQVEGKQEQEEKNTSIL